MSKFGVTMASLCTTCARGSQLGTMLDYIYLKTPDCVT
jgi:hypothetical protein